MAEYINKTSYLHIHNNTDIDIAISFLLRCICVADFLRLPRTAIINIVISRDSLHSSFSPMPFFMTPLTFFLHVDFRHFIAAFPSDIAFIFIFASVSDRRPTSSRFRLIFQTDFQYFRPIIMIDNYFSVFIIFRRHISICAWRRPRPCHQFYLHPRHLLSFFFRRATPTNAD